MEGYLDVKAIAEYLSVQPSTIYQWTHREYIPFYKLGNLLRFKLSEVEAWLKKYKRGGRARRVPSIQI